MVMTSRDLRRTGAASLVAATLALGLVTAAAAAPGQSDRLIVNVSGSALNTSSGGGTGALTWLHSFNSDALAGIGAEYDTVDNAHWTLAALTSSLSGGSAAHRWTVTADGRLGAGDIGPYRFNYDVEGLGVAQSLNRIVSLQFETRQFDIFTTHGNLPKAGVTLLLASRWLLGAAYAHSTGGNLGTVLTSVRLDHFGSRLSWFVGGTEGHVAPAVINVQTGAMGPVPRYWDAYAGITKTLTRTQWTISADYLDLLAGTRRATLTLTCSFLSTHP